MQEEKEEKNTKKGRKIEISEIQREPEHVKKIFKSLLKYIEEKDYTKIKELSNYTIHNASLYKDTESILIATTIYAISKILERKKYEEYEDWPIFYDSLKKNLSNCYKAIEENNVDLFRDSLSGVIKSVDKLGGHLREYLKQIFRKAKINKASRIYEHGISFGLTAEILGISLWELTEYVGQTGISNVPLTITKPITERMKFAKKIFE